MEPEKPQRMLRDAEAPESVNLDELRVVGAESESVPEFELVLSDDSVVRSSDWVGQKPFVVVFFATWCQVCEIKLPLVKAALDREPGIGLLLVSVDEPDTWRHVPGYLRELHLADRPVVSALENPRFTMGYDPMGAVPLVVVVGRDGRLVDYQIGLSGNDAPRLLDALGRAVRGSSPKAGEARDAGGLPPRYGLSDLRAR
jgi:thiol-disulfide isomerase/thioredoxin